MTTTPMADVIHLVRSEASRLRDYLAGLDQQSWSRPSSCEGWQVADVVSHLAQGAETWAEGLTRAMAGDASPPPGQAPLQPGERGSDITAQRAISFRQQKGGELLDTFISGSDRLDELLSRLRPADWEKPCFHRRGVIPVSLYVSRRVQELAIHGWDIRSGLDDSAELWEEPLPVLVGMVPVWLRNAFQPGLGLPTPMRYRFDIPGPVVVRQDVLVNHDSFELQPAGDARPDVTFRCNTGNYILVVYGRLGSDWGSVTGRLTIEGKREQATLFSTWFRGF